MEPLELPAKILEAKLYQAVRFGERYLVGLNSSLPNQKDIGMWLMPNEQIYLISDEDFVIVWASNIIHVKPERGNLAVKKPQKEQKSLKKAKASA